MRLSEFIRSHKEPILVEWEAFARTLLPASRQLNIAELRDHAEGILLTIARDLEAPQTEQQRHEKSRGRADPPLSEARSHGAVRADKGFTLAQMVSEFRALRASVLRQWSEVTGERGLDVYELIRFNEAVDQALAQSSRRFIEDLDRSKDLFLGILGHDLRNPLNAIMMSASQMEREVTTEGPLGKGLSRILRSSVRMREIIGDLLDFTRAHLGSGMPIFRAQVSLEDLARDTVEEVNAAHPESRVVLETSGDLRGEWDGTRLVQALTNLIGNAIDHGDRNVPVAVRAQGEADRVVLSVHNRGPPIPRELLEQIFFPLRRGEQDPAVSGMGLGLFIAKEIAVAHGGSIEVTSDAAHGTTFTLALPRWVPQDEGLFGPH